MSERLLEAHLLYQNPSGEILSLQTSSFSRMFPFSELDGVKAAWKKKKKKHVQRDAAENCLLFTSHFVLLWHWLPLFWAPLVSKMYLQGRWSKARWVYWEKTVPVLFWGLLNYSLRPKACCIYNGYMLCLFLLLFFSPKFKNKQKKYSMLFIWLRCFAFCLSKAVSHVFSL